MKLSDIITPSDDFHAISHRKEPFPTPEQMRAKKERLDHIFRAIDNCIRQCGPATSLPNDQEAAVMCATVLMIDDVMEYLTEKRKAS